MPGDSQSADHSAGHGLRADDGQDPAHVLIAEDEEHIARILGTLLEDASMQVTVTADGVAALERIRSDPTITLVILDVLLPEMGGLEVLRETRRWTPELPVIMLTARDEPEVREEAMTLGATEIFIKPFSPRELASRVRELCRR